MLVLSGCGSNDKVDDDGSANVQKIVALQTSVDTSGKDFNISVHIAKQISSKYTVALKNFQLLSVGGCTIESVNLPSDFEMTGGTGSYKNIQFSGTFVDDCTPTGYEIKFVQTTSDGSRSKTETVTYDSTASAGGGDSTETPVNGFFNATTPLVIAQADHDYEIKIQVLEGGYAASGKIVKAKPFESQYGDIINPTTNTGADGYAIFEYKSPKTLPANGSSVTITLTNDENGTLISKDIVLQFSSMGNGGSQYSLINETSIVATAPNSTKEISVHLIDATTGIGTPNKSVSITTISSIYGAIAKSTVLTDGGGKAIFEYTAPALLVNGTTSAVISFSDENMNTITKTIMITTVAPAGGGGTQYSFFNATDLNVTAASTKYQLSVDLINSATGVGISAEKVSISAISNTYGSITPSTVSTDAAGRATFIYSSPDALISGTVTATVRFTDTNGNTITENITIAVTPINSGISKYSFINESNITITKSNQKSDIKVQLTYNNIPAAGKTVTMDAFDQKQGGIISSYTVQTDTIGYATFTYQAPGSIRDLNGSTIQLTMRFSEDGVTLSKQANIFFEEKVTVEIDQNKPTVTISTDNPLRLTSNSQTEEIHIKVWKDNAPYTQGSVKVRLPDEAINGADIGFFQEYNVSVGSTGIAIFKYTGPSNLQKTMSDSRIDNNNSTFNFYHIESDSNKSTELHVEYELPASEYIARNYSVELATSGEFSMGIPDEEKSFDVKLIAQDAAGQIVPLIDENITKITVTSENTLIAELYNEDTNITQTTLDLNGTSFILKSKKLSGLVPLRVKVWFIDINGEAKDPIEIIVNVRVYSGPASAISISYVSIGQDKERAKYIETLAISVTDEYGNRVNTRPNISLGAIVGYAVDGREASGVETNETKRLFYGRDDVSTGNAGGIIDSLGDDDNSTTEFTDAVLSNVFRYANDEGNNTDKLVVFGERKNYEAMGKWDIIKKDNDTLALLDDYFGQNRNELYYAVGHNYYQDQCRQDGREWLGSTSSDTYQLDEEGTVTITYKYDYHLSGKDALIWVNLDGIQPDTGARTRVGEVVKHTLRSAGLMAVPTAGYSLTKGTSAVGRFWIWHEKAPERYRNAHFGYIVKRGSNCRSVEIQSSNSVYNVNADSNGTVLSSSIIGTVDARTCNNGAGNMGGSYIDFYLEAPPTKDCIFAIEGITVSSEF